MYLTALICPKPVLVLLINPFKHAYPILDDEATELGNAQEAYLSYYLQGRI